MIGKAVLSAATALALAACGAPPSASPSALSSSVPPAGKPAASASPSGAVAPLSPAITLKLAGSQTLAEAGVFIAEDKGYFRDLGIGIDYTVISPAFPTAVPQLATGALDAS